MQYISGYRTKTFWDSTQSATFGDYNEFSFFHRFESGAVGGFCEQRVDEGDEFRDGACFSAVAPLQHETVIRSSPGALFGWSRRIQVSFIEGGEISEVGKRNIQKGSLQRLNASVKCELSLNGDVCKVHKSVRRLEGMAGLFSPISRLLACQTVADIT